jgi:hypothetical protein
MRRFALTFGAPVLLLSAPSLFAGAVTGVAYWGAGSNMTTFQMLQSVSQTGGASYGDVLSFGAHGQVTMSGDASASYGVLHASASISVSRSPNNTFYAFQSAAWSDDMLTIDAPGLDGDSGFATFSLTVDGTESYSATTGLSTFSGAPAQTAVFIQDTPNATHWGAPTGAVGVINASGTYVFSKSIDFTYGTPFELYLELRPGGGLLPTSSSVSGWSGTATANFLNTAELSGIQVFEGTASSPGAQVNGFDITSASGTEYGSGGVTPEPGSPILLAGGAAILIWLRRRREARR